MTIKIILIILLLLVLRAFIVQRSLLVIKRVVAFVMFLALLLLVIFPQISTFIAGKIGVGRGVDLLFYFSHLFLLFLIVALWRRSLALTGTVTKLTRAIALQNPTTPQDKSPQQLED